MEGNDIVVVCPHCKQIVLIEQLNCRIFRHGVIIETGNQIDSHASKEVCDNLIKSKSIYGCGKPFQIIDGNIAVICDYI